METMMIKTGPVRYQAETSGPGGISQKPGATPPATASGAF